MKAYQLIFLAIQDTILLKVGERCSRWENFVSAEAAREYIEIHNSLKKSTVIVDCKLNGEGHNMVNFC